MIYLFTGTPGSGKSLHAARIILDRLRMRKPVICNFDVQHSINGYSGFFNYVDNSVLTPDYLMRFSHQWFGSKRVREEELTLIVDEAQLVFNSRDWSQGDRMAWIKFLSQHRHFGYRVILICQSDRMIDRQIRTLAEYDWQHRKLANFGFGGSLANLLLGGNLFCCVKVYYGLSDKLGSEFFRGSKKLYQVYDSYNLFDKPSDSCAARGVGAGGYPHATSAQESDGNTTAGCSRLVLGFRRVADKLAGSVSRLKSRFLVDSTEQVVEIPKGEGASWDEVFG